jgi:hypothetical protein
VGLRQLQYRFPKIRYLTFGDASFTFHDSPGKRHDLSASRRKSHQLR